MNRTEIELLICRRMKYLYIICALMMGLVLGYMFGYLEASFDVISIYEISEIAKDNLTNISKDYVLKVL